MADEINPEAQAPETTTPTATQAETPSVETSTNHQPEPAAGAEVDFEGMDAKTYSEFKDKVLSGEIKEAKAPDSAAAQPAAHTPTEEETRKAEEEAFDAEEAKKSRRFRTSDFEAQDLAAINLVRDMKAKGTPITLAEATTRVAAAYATEEAPDQTQEQAGPKTSAELTAHIDQLKADLITASKQVDTEGMVTIQAQLDDAREALRAAKDTEATSEAQAIAALNEKKADLRKSFPDFKDANSPLSQAWMKTYREMEAAGDPLLSDPVELTEFITLKVAKSLGINPVVEGSQPAKVTASVPTKPAKQTPPVQPASGSFRTMTPANTTGQLDQRIDSVSNIEDYEAIKAQLLSPAA